MKKALKYLSDLIQQFNSIIEGIIKMIFLLNSPQLRQAIRFISRNTKAVVQFCLVSPIEDHYEERIVKRIVGYLGLIFGTLGTAVYLLASIVLFTISLISIFNGLVLIGFEAMSLVALSLLSAKVCHVISERGLLDVKE